MPLEVRVVDLDDDHPQDTRRIAAEVEARGVEDVAEDTRVRDERDPPVIRVLALGAQMPEDRRAQVRRGHRPVVAVAEREQRSTGSTDGPDPSVDLVELREVRAR